MRPVCGEIVAFRPPLAVARRQRRPGGTRITPDLTRPPSSRRDLLKLGAGASALLAAPAVARAQTPKRGGTLSLRLWDPPHWDPHLTVSYKTHVLHTFSHSRLLKHRAGPSVAPGVFTPHADPGQS